MLTTFRDIMAASVAAQRINGTYYRKDSAPPEKLPNGSLMGQILSGNTEHGAVITSDQEEADLIIDYLSHKVMDMIAGNLENYWHSAVLLLERDSYNVADIKSLALIASIPGSYRNAVERDKVNQQMKDMASVSRHIGQLGDVFPQQSVTILGTVYSRTYLKHYHTAITADNMMIRFPLSDRYEREQVIRISGKVHKHGDNNTTVLHYVKVSKKTG